MARVVVAPGARRDLDELTRTHNLPPDTPERVARVIAPLETFPLMGPALGGRFAPRRFVIGPWRWMVIVYRWYEARDTVVVLSVQDGRSSSAATAARD